MHKNIATFMSLFILVTSSIFLTSSVHAWEKSDEGNHPKSPVSAQNISNNSNTNNNINQNSNTQNTAINNNNNQNSSNSNSVSINSAPLPQPTTLVAQAVPATVTFIPTVAPAVRVVQLPSTGASSSLSVLFLTLLPLGLLIRQKSLI